MQNNIFKEFLFIVLTIGLSMASLVTAKTDHSSWVVYYDDKLEAQAFAAYQLLVFDSDHHPAIEPLLEKDKTVLAYISLGEVESHRHWYNDVKREGILLQENKNWPGSFFVDVRDPRWTKRLIEKIIPNLLHRGFSGIFIDTLDNAAELERVNPKKYQGMTDAAAGIVKTIRRHYPGIKIMLNRAYEILPQVGDVIDMQLAESVYSNYSFKKKVYRRAKKNVYKNRVKVLQEAATKFHELEIYTLDYWDENDKEGIAEIYAAERDQGFKPYVSTIHLNKVISEP